MHRPIRMMNVSSCRSVVVID